MTFGDVVIDAVAYDSSWPYSSGIAMELDAGGDSATAATRNDSVDSWCAASSEIDGTTDLGSPGTNARLCTGILTK